MQTYHVHYINLATGQNLIMPVDATSHDAARLQVIHAHPLFSVIVTDVRAIQRFAA